jgi:membrane protease YdiL (CAAX protease family)
MAGLVVALLGIPAIVQGYRLALGPPASTPAFVAKEVTILIAAMLLLWIVRAKEGLPLASIGFGTAPIGRSILRGLLGVLLCAAGLAACLGLAKILGWPFGQGTLGSSTYEPPLWAVGLAVVRAGTVEEIFYRGYAIERLRSLTGKWIWYAAAPLVLFAAFHFRQGRAGILIAFVLGGILTWMYLKWRDLAANIATHFLVDFIPNILLPLLGAGR